MSECFARNGKGCRVLTIKRCQPNCPFFKTQEQVDEQAERTQRRLYSLPLHTIRDINKKYNLKIGGIQDD